MISARIMAQPLLYALCALLADFSSLNIRPGNETTARNPLNPGTLVIMRGLCVGQSRTFNGCASIYFFNIWRNQLTSRVNRLPFWLRQRPLPGAQPASQAFKPGPASLHHILSGGFMDSINSRIAEELGVRPQQVEAAVALLDEAPPYPSSLGIVRK